MPNQFKTLSRSRHDRLRIFCARPLVDAHPHAMLRKIAGASSSSPPDERAAKPSGNVAVSMVTIRKAKNVHPSCAGELRR